MQLSAHLLTLRAITDSSTEIYAVWEKESTLPAEQSLSYSKMEFSYFMILSTDLPRLTEHR